MTVKPAGCYIYGTYLEGARCNNDIHMIDVSIPMELYGSVSVTWLKLKEEVK